jgi:hypothetical protein
MLRAKIPLFLLPAQLKCGAKMEAFVEIWKPSHRTCCLRLDGETYALYLASAVLVSRVVEADSLR